MIDEFLCSCGDRSIQNVVPTILKLYKDQDNYAHRRHKPSVGVVLPKFESSLDLSKQITIRENIQ